MTEKRLTDSDIEEVEGQDFERGTAAGGGLLLRYEMLADKWASENCGDDLSLAWLQQGYRAGFLAARQLAFDSLQREAKSYELLPRSNYHRGLVGGSLFGAEIVVKLGEEEVEG